MGSKAYDTRRLSNEQIVDLLDLGLEAAGEPGAHATELQRLMGLSASQLLEAVRNSLRGHGLGVNEASRLLGVNELTAKRWFESAGTLADNARTRLAGLCVLLSLASSETRRFGAAQMVRSAVAALRKAADDSADVAHGEAARIVTSVFDVAGLMAAALYRMLTEEQETGAAEED
ncbi:MAG: hypothetical protein QUV05_15345 [Phycisphaerae bacterium]|nr:hypothetical protein [Phycisphaerae bacterium]